MWTEQLCADTYDEMKRSLSRATRDEQSIHNQLQRLCVQLTGRNATALEWQYLRHGDLVEFEVLLHGYLQERRAWFRPGGPAEILPPSGVVRQLGGQYLPLMGSPRVPALHP